MRRHSRATTEPEKSPPPQQSGESDDDELFDAGDPGMNYDPSLASSLSITDKSFLAKFKRPDPNAEEVETKPLTPLQKTITVGKVIQPTNVLEYPDQLEGLCTSFNNSGTMVAVGTRNSRVVMINPHNMEVMNVLDLSGGVAAPMAITSLKFRADQPNAQAQNVMIVAQEEKILHVHAGTGSVLSTIKEPGNRINNICIREDGQVFAACGSDKAVHVYDDHTGREITKLDHGDDIHTTGHSNHVYGLAFKPHDPNVIVSGGWDKTIQVWDLRVQRSVRSIYGPYICGDSIDIKGNTVLAGSWRHRSPLQLWDLASCELLTNLPFHQPVAEACNLYAAKFGRGTMDNHIFAGGSGKMPCLKMFQQTGELIGTMGVASAIHALDSFGTEKVRKLGLCCAFQYIMVDVPPSSF